MGNPREMDHNGDPFDLARQKLADESERYFKELKDVDEVSDEERQAIDAYAVMSLRIKFSKNGSALSREAKLCDIVQSCLRSAHESVSLMTIEVRGDLGEQSPGGDLIHEAIVTAVTSRHHRNGDVHEKEVFSAVCSEVNSLASKLHQLESIILPNGQVHKELVAFAKRRKKSFHKKDLFSVAYLKVRSKLLAGDFQIRSQRETIEFFKRAIRNAATELQRKHYGRNTSNASVSKPNPKQATSLEKDHGSTVAVDFAEREFLEQFRDEVLKLVLKDDNSNRKDCMLMHWFLDLSRKEIAEKLSIPIKTVNSHIRRGLRRLRDLLEPPTGPQTNE